VLKRRKRTEIEGILDVGRRRGRVERWSMMKMIERRKKIWLAWLQEESGSVHQVARMLHFGIEFGVSVGLDGMVDSEVVEQKKRTMGRAAFG
jgi:hypothetical protein